MYPSSRSQGINAFIFFFIHFYIFQISTSITYYLYHQKKKKQVFILKDTKISEMNDVLHLDSLLLLSWSTEVHYIIFIISQPGLCDLFLDYYKIFLAGPLPCPVHSAARVILPQHNSYNTPVLKTCQLCKVKKKKKKPVSVFPSFTS